MDEDVEGLQSTIYLLQTQLRESKEEIIKLRQSRERTSHSSEVSRDYEGHRDHRHTANGSSSPNVMDTDASAENQRTSGIQNHEEPTSQQNTAATNVHSPQAMETDSGVVSDSSPRTGTKAKPSPNENSIQNGMLEIQGTVVANT